MRNKLARPCVFCVFRSACRLLIGLAAMALALPISQAATPHPQISFIQLTNTSGCVGDGGSFYPTFDRLVKKVAFTSSCANLAIFGKTRRLSTLLTLHLNQ